MNRKGLKKAIFHECERKRASLLAVLAAALYSLTSLFLKFFSVTYPQL